MEFRDWDPVLALIRKIFQDHFQKHGLQCPHVSDSPIRKTISLESISVKCLHEKNSQLLKKEIFSLSSSSQFPIQTIHPFVGKSLYSISTQVKVTKQMLECSHVINQVENKFILCSFGTLLCVIDQHAAAERVLLEQFESEFFGDSGCSHKVLIHTLETPISLSFFTEHQHFLLQRFSMKLSYWGWQLDFSSGPFPILVSSPVLFDVCLSDPFFVVEYLQDLERCGGMSSIRPGIFTRLLQQKACRTAIKFGDSLTIEECSQLIQV